jgi:hypothetical protein
MLHTLSEPKLLKLQQIIELMVWGSVEFMIIFNFVVPELWDFELFWLIIFKPYQGRRGHDHMVVGFTTTYQISAYHH